MTVDYSGVTGANNGVYFNGVFLGNLDPTKMTMTFNVPVAAVASYNTIAVINNQATGTITLNKTFAEGEIEDNPEPFTPTPEPSTMMLALSGFGGLLIFAYRRRLQAEMGADSC